MFYDGEFDSGNTLFDCYGFLWEMLIQNSNTSEVKYFGGAHCLTLHLL